MTDAAHACYRVRAPYHTKSGTHTQTRSLELCLTPSHAGLDEVLTLATQALIPDSPFQTPAPMQDVRATLRRSAGPKWAAKELPAGIRSPTIPGLQPPSLPSPNVLSPSVHLHPKPVHQSITQPPNQAMKALISHTSVCEEILYCVPSRRLILIESHPAAASESWESRYTSAALSTPFEAFKVTAGSQRQDAAT